VQPKQPNSEANEDNDILPNDSDDDLELDFIRNRKGFVAAGQLDPLEIEQDVRSLRQPPLVNTNKSSLREKAQKKKAAALKALTEWTHINCLYPAAVEAVQDDILSQIIALNIDDDRPLDGEVEDDTEMPESRKAHMDELHDGAVTFLFEKRSESKMDE